MMFSKFSSKRSNHHFSLPLALRLARERCIKGELSQNQNNSIDGVARITRGTTISARWGAKTSRDIRKSIVAKEITVLYIFVRQKSIPLEFYSYFITLTSRF